VKTFSKGIWISIFPGLLMLVIFYTLAIHIRLSLGAWPDSIGDRGFSPFLSAHGRFAWRYCVVLTSATMAISPAGILLCLLVPRWRRCTLYFVLFGLFHLGCWGLMLLAPEPFLNWWWD
jgi:hypothetical protein